MKWIATKDPCGGYYWFTERLPNGWSGAVSDHSQSCAPRQTTAYTYSATCRRQIITGGTVAEFAEAKSLALSLALSQDASESGESCVVAQAEEGRCGNH